MTLKQLKDRYRARNKDRAEQELRSRFKVVERGTALWLTVDGIAIRQIDRDMDAAAIYGLLRDARIAAVTYHNICK